MYMHNHLARMAERLSFQEMESTTWVQILDELVRVLFHEPLCVSHQLW